MKIFVDRKIDHRVIQRMVPIWDSLGHKVTGSFKKGCAVQLCVTRRYTETGLPMVLRLDGVYYDLDPKLTPFRGRNNRHSLTHAIADGIIYQSKFSKKMCEHYLRKRKTNKTAVIYNGIAPNWAGGRLKHAGFNIVSSAKWRRHKRLKETIDLFLLYLKQCPNAKLHILGKLHDNVPVKHYNIIYYGMVDWEKMKTVYRNADLFIHLSKKDSCPNAVTEAIGSGIPVITTNACGGATEMAALTKGCVICAGDEDSIAACYPYSNPYNVISKTLRNNIIAAIAEIDKDRRKVILPKQLTIEYAAKEYLRMLKWVL